MDDFTIPTDELARCAKINLDNLADLNPTLKRHPFFVIASQQLAAVCERLTNGFGQDKE